MNVYTLAFVIYMISFYMRLSPCEDHILSIGVMTFSKVQVKRGLTFSIFTASLSSWVTLLTDQS